MFNLMFIVDLPTVVGTGWHTVIVEPPPSACRSRVLYDSNWFSALRTRDMRTA